MLQALSPSSLAAAVYESVVAAIYLDAGFEAVREYVLRTMSPKIDVIASNSHQHNYKAMLQQHAQKEMGSAPLYQLLDEKGPDHSKCFKIAALIGRFTHAAAWGRTKKEAEQRAAMNALAQIHGEPLPFEHD